MGDQVRRQHLPTHAYVNWRRKSNHLTEDWAPVPFVVIAVVAGLGEGDVCVGIARVSKRDRFVKAVGRIIAEERAHARAEHLQRHGEEVHWTTTFKSGSEEERLFWQHLQYFRFQHVMKSYDEACAELRRFCQRTGIVYVPHAKEARRS